MRGADLGNVMLGRGPTEGRHIKSREHVITRTVGEA